MALISVSLDVSLSQTPVYTVRPHRVVRLFMPQLLLVLTAPTHSWVAWGGWLHAQMVYTSSDGHPSKH